MSCNNGVYVVSGSQFKQNPLLPAGCFRPAVSDALGKIHSHELYILRQNHFITPPTSLIARSANHLSISCGSYLTQPRHVVSTSFLLSTVPEAGAQLGSCLAVLGQLYRSGGSLRLNRHPSSLFHITQPRWVPLQRSVTYQVPNDEELADMACMNS